MVFFLHLSSYSGVVSRGVLSFRIKFDLTADNCACLIYSVEVFYD